MPRRLDISIRPDGTISAEASGTPGPDCLDALEQLRALLHAEVSDSKPTPEFSQSAASVRITDTEHQRMEDRA